MIKNILGLILAVLLAVNIYGCFLLIAGAAGGAGTAVWLGGKLTQEVNASYDRSIQATRSALNSLNLEITKEAKGEHVCQFKAIFTDGSTVWVDIRKITETSSKIEVRVGAVSDKEAASKILDRIKQYL